MKIYGSCTNVEQYFEIVTNIKVMEKNMDIFSVVKNELIVILFSMLPIVELRGGIPLAIGMGFTPFKGFLLSVLGNLIPIPFLIKLYKPIIRFIARSRFLVKPASWVVKKVDSSSKKVKKYELLGLFLLVAIPLPTTGAWTGSAVAAFLKLDFKKSWLIISLGVATAGIIMLLLSYFGLMVL